MQFLRSYVEHLLYLIPVHRGIELCPTMAPFSYLEIGCFYLYLLMIYHFSCVFFLSMMQTAPLTQQPKRIIKLFSNFVHLLGVLIFQPIYLPLVYPLVVTSFFEQLIILLSDLYIKMFQLIERLWFYLRLIRVISFECVLFIYLINVLVILEIVS